MKLTEDKELMEDGTKVGKLGEESEGVLLEYPKVGGDVNAED